MKLKHVICIIICSVFLIPDIGNCSTVPASIEISTNINSRVPVEKKSKKIKKLKKNRSKLKKRKTWSINQINYRTALKKGLIYSNLAAIFITLAIGLAALLILVFNSLSGYAASFLIILLVLLLIALFILHTIFSINAIIQFAKSANTETINREVKEDIKRKIKKRRHGRHTLKNTLD